MSEENQRRRTRRRERPAKKKKGGILAICLAALVLAGIGYGVHTWADYSGTLQSSAEVTVEIPTGSSGRQIAAQLAEDGIISHKTVFYYYLRLNGSGANLKPGSYDLRSDMSYQQIVEALSAGNQREDVARITFPEGLSLREIADLLEEKGVCPADAFLDYLDTADLSRYDFVAELPDDDRYHKLEGYIFPDTYDFYIGEAPASVAGRFLDRFEQIVDQEIRDRAREMGMTINEVVTLASVIQAECSYPSEMANVSGVFHNRLDDPANYPKLQSDVTIFYIRDEILPYAGSDTENFYDQLYNTYIHSGLPVGPICSPGEDALKAALYPTDHDYYYFITDKESNFLYAETLAEHNANIRKAGI